METTGEDEKTIQSARTALAIIETIAEQDNPTITDIADAVDCSRSTVHYHLKTLQQSNYVVRTEDGLYLGLRMARLGNVALRKHRLTGIIEEMTDDLAVESDTVARVGVKEGNHLVWLYQSSNGDPDPVPGAVGEETPLHCTAYGQAILASAPTDTIETVVAESGLPVVTENTITERESLADRLATVRQLGFAYSPEEYRIGVSSIAAPIFDESDTVIGAIGITDSHSHIDNPYRHPKARRFSDELPGHVQKTARIASDTVSNP